MLATEEGRRNWNEHIGECDLILEHATREVRTMSYLFYPPMVEELGLKAAVRSYLKGFRQRSGIHIDFQADEDFGRSSSDRRQISPTFRVAYKKKGSQKLGAS